MWEDDTSIGSSNAQIIDKELREFLYINRITFLSGREKFLLATEHIVQDKSLFMRLEHFSHRDWTDILGRRVLESSWNREKHMQIVHELAYDIHWLQIERGSVCKCTDSKFPTLLMSIYDPPILLFYRGNETALENAGVSVVGTRRPNKEGYRASYEIGKFYAQAGYNVVSGLAFGVDIASHKGMLDGCVGDWNIANELPENAREQYVRHDKNDDKSCETSTKHSSMPRGVGVVVLGTSIDKIYPKAHIMLAQRILQSGGVIVSEVSPRMNIGRHCFIARNRIISGLTMHTILVQAPAKSGALATAQFALEQGRELWVHECGISTDYRGTLELYINGAHRFTECVNLDIAKHN